MKPKIPTILFLIILFVTEGCGASILSSFSRIHNGGSTQLLLFFDETPLYDAHISGKRLDVSLIDTTIGSDITIPESDDIIARAQLTEENNSIVLTIFFRYSPQHMQIYPGPTNSLAVSLVPGNRFTKTYQELMAGLGPLIKNSKEPQTTVDPLTFSPYAADWRSFFEKYHGFSFIELSPHFHFPRFPLTALLSGEQAGALLNLNSMSADVIGSDWFSVLAEIQTSLKVTDDIQERQDLALTYADLLYRLGNSRAAHEQFTLLHRSYPDSPIGKLADYARIVIDAQNHQFYEAQVQLERILAQQTQSSLLASHIRLSLAECFLATGQYQMAQLHLEDSEPVPEELIVKKDIRLADLFIHSDRFQQAETIMVSYQDLDMEALQPYSLNNYCSLLHSQGRFNESSSCYQILETRLRDSKKQANARYLSVLGRFQKETRPLIEDQFREITNRFPGSPAAMRAELKLADMCYLKESDCSGDALDIYKKVATQSISRDIALEAQFKTALIYHLSGYDEKAVVQLDTLLRNFRSGKLRNDAMALLIDILPTVLSKMLEQDRYVEALSLAQQNRELFVNDYIDHSFLFSLGLALEKLSLYHDALNVFLFLKKFEDFHLDEQLLLALTRVSHALADHHLVEEFSSTYLLNFPDGALRQDIRLYQIDSTLVAGQIERALKLLPEPLPLRRDYTLLAASIHFLAANYQASADLLEPLTPYSELPENHRLMLAESFLSTGRHDRCVELYELLQENKVFMDLARYRLAQISQQEQDEDQIKGNSPLFEVEINKSYWNRLYAQQQKFEQLMQLL